jgi:hypothetical protein
MGFASTDFTPSILEMVELTTVELSLQTQLGTLSTTVLSAAKAGVLSPKETPARVPIRKNITDFRNIIDFLLLFFWTAF